MTNRSDRSPPQELDPPAEALDAKAAFEVLRAWIADGHLHVTFEAETFTHDVGEWGRMLADISHHIARAIALGGQLTEREALTTIAESFENGVSASSTVATGRMRNRTQH